MEISMQNYKKKEKIVINFMNASGVMVIAVGNGHGNTSSNSGRD